MRAALEIIIFIAGLAILGLIAKGLTPVFPALGTLLRGLIHPVSIVLILGLFLLLRAGRGHRGRTTSRPPGE